MSKRDILILVEGQVTDVKLMARLLTLYGIYEEHQIVYYGTDIYSLYDSMYHDKDGRAVLDLLLHLRSREKNPEKKDILSKLYSRILLIFDLDPQSTHYSSDKIHKMTEYFNDSTDIGMLYINYPMVEAFYHVKNMPDPEYVTYNATITELKRKNDTYKDRVSKESCIKDRKSIFNNRNACNIIIRQNLEKAWHIVRDKPSNTSPIPNQDMILHNQLMLLKTDHIVSVLCTCCFYISEYNASFIYN
jgi:hypothetical protein